MNKMLKIELNRAVHSRGTMISLSCGSLLAIIHFVICVLPLREFIDGDIYPLSAFSKWMCGDDSTVFPTLYYFVLPVLVALPHAGSLWEDIQSGYIKNIAVRVKKEQYMIAKYLAVFITGGSVAIIPLILNFMLTGLVLPVIIPQSNTGYFPIFSYSLLGDLFYSHPLLYLGANLSINFVYMGLLATLALLATYWCENLFTTVLTPFIVYLFLYALTQITELHQICPMGFLRASQPVVTEVEILLGECLIMVCAGGVCYYAGTKKDIL